MTPSANSQRLFGAPPAVWAGALTFPLLYMGVSLSWYARAPAGQRYIGFLQNDQHLYTAYARAVTARGNGLFYANPHDADPDAPRILTNLGYLALAWTRAIIRPLAGDSWVSVWELLRLAGGVAMAVLLYRLIAALVDGKRRQLFFWALALTGGGVAWLLALPDAGRFGWLGAAIRLEDGAGVRPSYAWWLTSVFRQGSSPLETVYHALLYGTFVAYLARRPVATLLLFFLLWWAHPLTAMLATTALCAAAGIESFWRSERRVHLALLAGTVAITALFAWYNRVFVPSFPSGRSLMEQTLHTFEHRLRWDYVVPAWGFFLLAIPAALATRESRRFLLDDRRGRFALGWFATVFLWTRNDWLLGDRAIVPMHFTRGHVLLALVLLGASAARGAPGDSLRARLSPAALKALIAAALIVGAADSAFFVARLATRLPYPGLLTLSEAQLDTLERLNELPPAQTFLCLDPPDFRFNTLIPSLTPHRVYLGDLYMTPFYSEKSAALVAFIATGDAHLLDQYAIGWLIYEKARTGRERIEKILAHFEELYDNGVFVICRRAGNAANGGLLALDRARGAPRQ